MVRKVRSDKKKEVKPTVKIELKEAIYRISYITRIPVKDVAEELTLIVLNEKKVIEHLSQFFQRNFHWGNTIFFGTVMNSEIDKRLKGKTDRITIKFKRIDYNMIADLALALDCSESRVTAILLDIAINNIQFVNRYMRKYLDGELSEKQIKELQTLLRYVNKVNETHHSWLSLLSYIIDEVNAPISRIREAVREFLNKEDD